MGAVLRQGDIALIAIDRIPIRAKAQGHLVLAHGEATGHHHAVYGRATLFRPEGWGSGGWLAVEETSELRHEEHHTLTIPPGRYLVAVQVEETAEATQLVFD